MHRFFTSVLFVFGIIYGLSAQVVVYQTNCNSMAGWTNTGMRYPGNTPGYNWYSVNPIVPPNDHTGGGNCFYTEGNNFYVQAGALHWIDYRLESPVINLAGSNDTRILFWMQLRYEQNNWEGTWVECSSDGGITWTQISTCMAYDGLFSQNPSSLPYYPYLHTGWYFFRTTWTRVLIDVSQYDNQPTFQFRFVLHSDEALSYQGWAVDDIAVISSTTLNVEGNNIVISHNDITPQVPDGTDFGKVIIGNNITQTFEIHNIGQETISLTGTPMAQITGGPGFTVTQQPANNTIPPNGMETFVVQFAPSQVGVVSANISIPNTDSVSACTTPNPYVFRISGENLNTPPYITNAINDTFVCPGTPVTINFLIHDNEQPEDTVLISGTSSNTTIVPATGIAFGGIDTNRSITVTPSGNNLGSTTITITLDDQMTDNPDSTFSFTIHYVDTIPPTPVCQNLTIQLNSAGTASITPQQVDNGSTDNCTITNLALSKQNFTCADVGQQIVYLIVTDIGNNQDSCASTITVLPYPMSHQTTVSSFNGGYEISCHGATDGFINIITTDGCPPYQYNWYNNTGVNGSNPQNLPAGTYEVEITDAAGQTDTLVFTLTQPDSLILTITGINPSCAGKVDGSISATATGGTQPYAFNPSANISPLAAGTYPINVVDVNGCMALDSITLLEPAPIEITGQDAYSIICSEEILFAPTITGGTGQYKYTWKPDEYLNCSDCPATMAKPLESINYLLTVEDVRGCKASFDILVDVSCQIYIPNAFTPNGDGLNDIFKVKGIPLDKFEMLIFNRWGEQIFASKKQDYGWNGFVNNTGKRAAQNTYVYRVNYILPGGDEFVVSGRVTLIK